MSSIRLSAISVHLFLMLFASTAAWGQWQSIGLQGDQVNFVFANDTAIFATSQYEGISYSGDDGLSWHTINSGIYDTIYDNMNHRNLRGIVGSGNHVYAASSDTIYQLDGSGQHWTAVHAAKDDGLSDQYYRLSSNQDVLFAQIFDYNGIGRVGRSDDNGISWTFIPDSKSFGFRGNEAFFCSFNKVFHSTDNGLSYSQIATEGFPPLVFIYSLVVSGNDEVLLSTGVMNSGVVTAIRRSQDDGATWDSIAPNPGRFSYMVADGPMVFAKSYLNGVHYSTDGGRSWGIYNDGLSTVFINDLLIHPEWIYAATDNGVYRLSRANFTGLPSETVGELSLSVYPNPCSDVLHLNVPTELKGSILKVSEVSGRQLYAIQLSGQDVTIDVSHWSEGVYLLSIEDHTNVSVSKVVLAHPSR